MLSRAFVYRAVSSPPSGFKTEINSYYLMADNIQNVILHARRLMDKTAALDKGQQGGASWDADAIGSLTAGAKLSLEVSKHPSDSYKERLLIYSAPLSVSKLSDEITSSLSRPPNKLSAAKIT